MCLDPNKNNRFSWKPHGSSKIRWKVAIDVGAKAWLSAPIRCTPYYYDMVNKAQPAPKGSSRKDRVNFGFHVFTTRKIAEAYARGRNQQLVIKVKVGKFVAAGTFGFSARTDDGIEPTRANCETWKELTILSVINPVTGAVIRRHPRYKQLTKKHVPKQNKKRNTKKAIQKK